MSLAVNGQALKRLRVGRALSQEQLSDISGISLRTIQRLEQGGKASLETAKALSAAMNVTRQTFTDSVKGGIDTVGNGFIRRITPLMVLSDITPLLQNYGRLGFSIVDTGDPGCVGLKAGVSYLILASTCFMEIDYRRASVALLSGRVISYIHVQSGGHLKQRLLPAATILEEVKTRGGTIETLVEDGGHYMIFAEKALA